MKRRFKRMASVAFTVALTIAISTFLVAPDRAISQESHYKNNDSVTNRHIFYEDDMNRFHRALDYADERWSSEGRIMIKKTPRDKRPTLRFIVVEDPAVFVCGYWNPNPSPDLIWVNRPQIASGRCGSNAPNSLFLHEMGHALRIDDHDGTRYWYDVMFRTMIRHDQYGNSWQCPLTLQPHDKTDYHQYWG